MDCAEISRHSVPQICRHQQSDIHHYLIKKGSNKEESKIIKNIESNQYFAYNEPVVNITQPRVCVFEFMSKSELEEFMKNEVESEIKKIIGKH